jgi:TRAP-type uncharacterized transport system substrate-binding protein
MGRQKIRPLMPKSWALIYGVILVIIIIAVFVSYRVIRPVPPDTLVMATGTPAGSYAAYGELYRKILARDGIRLVLRGTSGAVENLRLLKDESQAVDAGFVQGTTGIITEKSNLVSLGSLTYTPLWVFYKSDDEMDDLSRLKGKKIAIGPEGSGVRKFSLDLLKTAGISGPPTVLHEIPTHVAKNDLQAGRVDAVMVIGSTDNQLIQELLHAKGIRLMSFSLAEAYARYFPDLSHVVLPKGIINPARRFPRSDVHLLSTTTNLIVRRDLHPALVYLLLKASVEIHGGAGWVNKTGEFPSLAKQDDPISDQARRFYKSGGSWLYSYLPFWAATFIDGIILLLIPIGMIIIPFMGLAPWIYTWRNRSKYYPLYRELRKIEGELADNFRPDNFRSYEARLDSIEEAVGKVHTSVAFYDELYILKEHVHIVRLKIASLTHKQTKKNK